MLSSASKWRRHVVPREPRESDDKTSKTGRPARTTDVSRTLAAAPIARTEACKPSGDASRGCLNAATNYIDWHTLLERVYDIDSLECPRCGAGLRFIAVLTEPERTESSLLDGVRGGPRGRRPSEPEPIRAILESMGLSSTPPVPARARTPTLFEDSQFADCDVA